MSTLKSCHVSRSYSCTCGFVTGENKRGCECDICYSKVELRHPVDFQCQAEVSKVVRDACSKIAGTSALRNIFLREAARFHDKFLAAQHLGKGKKSRLICSNFIK